MNLLDLPIMALPHHSLFIDSCPTHFCQALKFCLKAGKNERGKVTSKLEQLWTTPANPNPVLPCLSVRSGLDLYLQAQNYPEGSEVIITAINIQDVVHVIRHHKLKVIPVDISIDTLGPLRKDLEGLVTCRTVAILVAHLYGRWVDLDPIFAVADRYNLHIIEDCAESFCGFSNIGHPKSDISLFSFGVIKFSTAFGGAIAKIKNQDLWVKMKTLHSGYSLQTNQAYQKKVLKYLLLYMAMYTWPIPHLTQVGYRAGLNPKELFVKFIRGFPGDTLIQAIRHQPSPALLSTMLYTFTTFDPEAFALNRKKGEYFLSKLTRGMYPVGTGVELNNHWLFPVIVINPDECVERLNQQGVSAYRGCTQLSLVEGDCVCGSAGRDGTPPSHLVYSRSRRLSAVEGNSVSTNTSHLTLTSHLENTGCDHNFMDGNVQIPSCTSTLRPVVPVAHRASGYSLQGARYLMSHVIYLPVNKRVPFRDLAKMADICAEVVASECVVVPQSGHGGAAVRGKLGVSLSWAKARL